jgi:hypothetical protein
LNPQLLHHLTQLGGILPPSQLFFFAPMVVIPLERAMPIPIQAQRYPVFFHHRPQHLQVSDRVLALQLESGCQHFAGRIVLKPK